MLQPNTLAAVGIKPGNSPLPLRFVTFRDKTPGAGYTLTARTVPNGAIREVGMTDRAGRIVLKPGFADGLVILRLLAGNIEPVREFPIMPGESSEERTIPFDPKYPERRRWRWRWTRLRDEVVDLIALRARLEARMKARLEGEDWVGLEDAIKEFNRLTPRDEYAKKLAEIKERATKQQVENKVAILTKNAQAQINDLQAMIDRYLDDDAIKAYRECPPGGPGRDGREGEGQAQGGRRCRQGRQGGGGRHQGRASGGGEDSQGGLAGEGGTGRPARARGTNKPRPIRPPARAPAVPF